MIALRFDAAGRARAGMEKCLSDVMVALNGQQMNFMPIEETYGQMKSVPIDSDIIQTAKDLGISFCEPD